MQTNKNDPQIDMPQKPSNQTLREQVVVGANTRPDERQTNPKKTTARNTSLKNKNKTRRVAPVDEVQPISVDRTDRPARIGFLLLFAGVLVGAAVALSFIAGSKEQPFIVGLLALLAVVGVFALFAFSIGLLQFAGTGARNDLTKIICATADEGLIAVEESGRVIYANELYMAMVNAKTLADLRPVDRLFSGAADVSESIYRLSQAAREERVTTEEIRLTPALSGGGSAGWYRVQARLIKRPSGRCILWSVKDVTRERNRQENVFQELQHAIDYLDHAPAGFISIEADGSIVYMNATLAAWIGHDLAKIGATGFKIHDIASKRAAALILGIKGRAGEVKTEIIDIDLNQRSGLTLPVRLHHRIAFDQNGKAGASRTLVMNRLSGEEVDEAKRIAEVNFARFFHDSPFAIATVNKDGNFLRTNASFSRIFGDILGKTSTQQNPSIIELLREQEHDGLQNAIESARKHGAEIAPIDLMLAKDTTRVASVTDKDRSARFYISPTEDNNNTGEVALIYILETTDQRDLENQFAQAQKMQAVGQLAGGVAHDFNNVLQAIIGYSDLLLVHHRPTDPSFQDIMQIKQNANRAASLVRQLLAFSRRQTLRPQVVELGDVLSDLSIMLKRLLGERVELDLKHGRDLWPVKADVNQFEQVIVNLVVNAKDAMPQGGQVLIRTANVIEDEIVSYNYRGLPHADYVLIEVQDNGSGIPQDVMNKMFEPFFTTKDIGKGTGLGLSTVYGIIKQTGGFIYCDSEVDKGTCFRVFLPRHIVIKEAIVASPFVAITPEAVPAPAEDMTGRGAILLVEDEEAVRAFGARALSSRGYTVIEASSGVEALERLDEIDTPIDLIVSDVVMPEMDGPTLLSELRKRGIKAKIIFCSGYAEEAFKKNLPEGEDFGFLPKPFTLKQLIETVKTTIASLPTPPKND